MILFQKPETSRANSGSVVLIALLSILVLSAIAAEVLRTVVPRYQVSVQTAGWQEARLAAEAGVEMAMVDLNKASANYLTYSWPNWYQTVSGTTQAATGSCLMRSSSNVVTTGNVLCSGSNYIFLDNVDISPTTGLPARVDVQLTALYPDPDTTDVNCVWFRIRSMGTAQISGPPRAAADKMDTALRKISLLNMRSTLLANDYGRAVSADLPTPNASRIIEALAKPIPLYANALVTQNQMTLGTSDDWEVDSYDSRDPNKSKTNPAYPSTDSTHGIYPGSWSSKVQKNGNIGTDGNLIDANGATVKGSAGTNNGTITGGQKITGTVTSNFSESLSSPTWPTVSTYQVNPDYNNSVPFTAGGSQSSPYYYHITGNLGSFTVSSPPTGSTSAYVVIMVDGDLNLGNGNSAYITIPPGVTCVLDVKGNIEFGNGMVNTNTTSNHIPSMLQINGIPTYDAFNNLNTRTIDVSGNAQVAAVVDAPTYQATVNGSADWSGALIVSYYQISGGGWGGLHYDEALSSQSTISGFEVANCFEDSRQ